MVRIASGRSSVSALSASVWLVLGVAGVSAVAGEPPRLIYLSMQENYLAAQENPPLLPHPLVYNKRATWHETLRVSVDATFPGSVASAAGAASESFRPAMVRLMRGAEPVTLTFSVADVDQLYLAAVGRQPAHGSACFLNPRLWDRQGRCQELQLGGSIATGEVTQQQAQPVEVDIAGQSHRGIAVALGEINFQLDRQYERFEVEVYYEPQVGLPPYAAVDAQPICQRADEFRQTFTALWERVAQDFRDRQSQIEMECELRDGIWNPYAPAGGGASGDYYLARCRERLDLARRTLALVEPLVPLPELAAELAAFTERVDGATDGLDSTGARELFAQAVALRRR
ncbi:MAG: hypothetical protein MUF48_21065, partial [Pirellulaceae bacterium]|nr:hypothetical protein [Pirellulaceae bacterium]